MRRSGTGWAAARGLFGLVAGSLLACGAPENPGSSSVDASTGSRPNVLLIVADDLGYADLGSFGSDIRTPNLDRLAARGIRFTQFHTSPYCAPTRAMLLSGNNNHVAGMGMQSPPDRLRARVRGYEGHLSDRVVPLPRLLSDAGYRTYAVGKWHLGTRPENGPRAAGFERSFMLLHGAASHYGSAGFFEGGSLYAEDGAPAGWPEDAYSTEVYTDRLLSYLDADLADDRPFFAYAAFTSPHWPLQVPETYRDRYEGRYDAGYDALRERNFASLKRAGIVPARSRLPPRNEAVTPWDDLEPGERRREARKMELYAAMVENLDHHVGRILAFLEERGLDESTLVLFLSDNGAAAEDFYNVGPYRGYLRARYDNALRNMGRASSWVSYGRQWAEAGSAPFSRHKGYTREGGIVAPMIVAGAGVAGRGAIDRSYLTAMDIAPTILDIAGARYPSDGSVAPMLGSSMRDLLAGRAAYVHDSLYVTILHHRDRALLRQGRWKLVTLEGPFAEEKFELYDVVADPGETTNLAAVEPETYSRLLELWRTKRRETGIVLPGEPGPDEGS